MPAVLKSLVLENKRPNDNYNHNYDHDHDRYVHIPEKIHFQIPTFLSTYWHILTPSVIFDRY